LYILFAWPGIWEWSAFALVIALSWGYGAGWRRLRGVVPTLATRARLAVWIIAMAAVLLALVWPLPVAGNYLLSLRALQKTLLCMVAAPLIWLACPLPMLAWVSRGKRRSVALRRLLRLPPLRALGHALRQPTLRWFAYVGLFLLWHDPASAQYLLGDTWGHHAAPWLLGAAALGFWRPVVDTRPRTQRAFPAWLLIVYLLGVEIANMVAGITIAFSHEPVYAYYPALRAQLPPDSLPLSLNHDQMLAGALIWVFGSLVYIAAIVGVVHDLFRQSGSATPQPLPNWDDPAKFIAPGLEHRLAEKTRLDHDGWRPRG